MKNVIEFNNFKDKKTGEMIKENTIRLDDVFRVMGFIDVPVSLINAYFKKVQDETGKKLREIYSDTQIAEMMVDYIKTSYLNIENFPVEISLGTGGKGAQVQPVQTQPQAQVQEPKAQVQEPQAQVPQGQAQAPQGQAQGGQTQGSQVPAQTAQEIKPQEI
jgi:hypothetical protein